MSDGSDDMMRLAHDLTRTSVTVTNRAADAMVKALTDIKGRAQAIAPVDTGALRNSVTTDTSRQGGTLRGEVGPTVNYGGFVENGTSRQRAQPYLRPATDAVVPGYQAALEQITRDL